MTIALVKVDAGLGQSDHCWHVMEKLASSAEKTALADCDVHALGYRSTRCSTWFYEHWKGRLRRLVRSESKQEQTNSKFLIDSAPSYHLKQSIGQRIFFLVVWEWADECKKSANEHIDSTSLSCHSTTANCHINCCWLMSCCNNADTKNIKSCFRQKHMRLSCNKTVH